MHKLLSPQLVCFKYIQTLLSHASKVYMYMYLYMVERI